MRGGTWFETKVADFDTYGSIFFSWQTVTIAAFKPDCEASFPRTAQPDQNDLHLVGKRPPVVFSVLPVTDHCIHALVHDVAWRLLPGIRMDRCSYFSEGHSNSVRQHWRKREIRPYSCVRIYNTVYIIAAWKLPGANSYCIICIHYRTNGLTSYMIQ